MNWTLKVPPGTPATAVMSVLRKQHDALAEVDPKGLPADVEDQIGAAIRAVDVVWHEVATHDADGNPTGTVTGSISGDASAGQMQVTIVLAQG